MNSQRPVVYFLLLAVQLCGVVGFIFAKLPEFRQVVTNPGVHPLRSDYADLLMIGIFAVMQAAFWFRMFHVPVPRRTPNKFLSHLFLFLSRLSFIFGSALFSVVVFRHLPEMGPDTNVPLTALRGLIFLACLFALFCTSLEVERLALAFEPRGPEPDKS